MEANDGHLGTCPRCGSVVERRDELISYTRSDDSVGVFAECPSCASVVAPRES